MKNQELFSSVFVTVGNGQFDPLIKEIDCLKKDNIISGKVIIQIGHGKYQPQHCDFFRFAPDLEKYYAKASFVISHGGPGTVFEILRHKIPFIALANKDRTDPMHQVEFLEGISNETPGLLYCPQVAQLSKKIKKAIEHEFLSYNPPKCTIHNLVNNFLNQIDDKKKI